MPSVSDAVTLDGKLFQMSMSSVEERPVTNITVERRDDGVTRADVDAERSRLLASMSATRHVQLVRQVVVTR